MPILSSFYDIYSRMKSTFLRFPLPLFWAIIGTIFTLWYIDQQIDHNIEFNYIKVIITFVLGVSWLIATNLLVLYFKEIKKTNLHWLMLIPLILLAYYFYSLPNSKLGFEHVIVPYRFVLYLVIGHLFILFSPFILFWEKHIYWNYLKTIFIAIIKSIFFSLVIFLGLLLALMSMKYLFHFDFKEKVYFQLFLFCLGIINTWLFLSDIPVRFLSDSKIYYPRPLEVFTKYILIPITILYLVILYAYGFKILFNWSLPKGWVSYLVIILSMLGFLIHILINPIRKMVKSSFIKLFYPWFYYALLPMILLLFIAVFKRIIDYGYTENRYLLLVFAFWILGIIIYILSSKHKKLRNLTMSLAVLGLLTSFGFWGMFSVSNTSQINEFSRLFVHMKSTNFEVKVQDRNRLESILRYLDDRNSLDQISSVLGYNPSEVFNTDKWSLVNKILDSTNMVIIDYDSQFGRLGYQQYISPENGILNVRGYDYLLKFYLNSNNMIGRPRGLLLKDTNIVSISLDTVSKSSVILMRNNIKLHELSLKKMLSRLDSLVGITNHRSTHYSDNTKTFDQDEMSIYKSYDDMNIKIIFQSLEINRDSINNEPHISHANGQLLIEEL